MKRIELRIPDVLDVGQEYFKTVTRICHFSDLRLTMVLQTTFSEHCRSWYKVGKADGRVVAIWPGNSSFFCYILCSVAPDTPAISRFNSSRDPDIQESAMGGLQL